MDINYGLVALGAFVIARIIWSRFGSKTDKHQSGSTSPTSSGEADGSLDKLYQFAGLFAMHGLISISKAGGPLTPIFASEDSQGTEMVRLANARIEEGAAFGLKLLEQKKKADRAVVVYDGFIHLDEGKTDALIVQGVEYGPPRKEIKVALPYRDAKTKGGFAFYRPKLAGFPKGIADQQFERYAKAFSDGTDKHPEGTAFWDKYYDSSR